MQEHPSERQSEPDCEYRLLRQYVERGCQAAFGQIVSRYSGLVYSTCLRQVREAALAEDATQSVFLLLAMKAPGLPPGTVLSGWLYRTACFVVRDLRKQELRRKLREEAMAREQMIQDSHQAREDETWDSVAPLLDDALASLGDQDQTAVVLRFFEGRSLRETGTALGISEAAAQMRVVRSLEKLRRFFVRRGVTVAGVALASLLTTRAVHAAPLGCTASVLQALARQAEWYATPGGSGTAPAMPPLGGLKGRPFWQRIPWAAMVAAILVIGLTVSLGHSHIPTRAMLSPKAIPVQRNAAQTPAAPALTGVYICRICRCYYSPAQAKARGYTEGSGPLAHHLVYVAHPPAGYTNEENSFSSPAPHKG
ncbi:MAG: sigma-70 family RNA polymerase sigma factor [Armatimonadota bacterium]|nr:sigma-70 family RNA polymerase sigma factor [Armatimonadota bacterium]